ncbi:MAG: integration host factor subunit alpha [Deltaproteobacteria bacterium]|jgi:integration host factor subunit alpha|nr:integration host factor subunit alpha [Deltaproteobacteria bacterium]
MTVTKADIVDSVSKRLGMPKRRSAEVVESMLEVVKKTLGNGEDVLISGFGKFCVRDKDQRRGRNPQTGEDMILRPRRVVTLRCSPVLKDKVNGR